MSFPSSSRCPVAVVTGRHNFDVPAFHDMFRSMAGIDFYLQDLENLVADTQGVRDGYEALVFYNFHRDIPEDKLQEQLGRLGRSKQGIVVIHHALLAFPQWEAWSQICGIEDRTFKYYPGQTVEVQVADPDHPITVGMPGWTMVDETYLMPDAGPGSRVLLTTDHPNSLHTLAWVRSFGNARVFCTASGHGYETYADPHFRRLLERGILWAAGRL